MKVLRKIKTAKERYDERHRTSGLGIVLADSIHFLNAAHWDALVKEKSVFLGRPYLSNLELNGPDNIESRYALIYRQEQPVAALHCEFVEVSGDQFSGGKSWGFLRERLLIAGDLLSTGPHGVAFAKGEDPASIWPAIMEALYRLRRAEKLSGQTDIVMIKDFEGAGPVDALRRFAYRPVQTEPNMVLNIPASWKSYADYLASMTSKYRKSIRDINERVEAAGITLEVVSDLQPLSASLHALYRQVQEGADIRFFELPPPFLPALARSLGDAFCCIVLRRENEVLGFATTVRDGDTTVGYFIGFDRQINQSTPIYFRLLNAIVEKAIESGSARLSLGRTALEPKARIGAAAVPTYVWMRHRVSVVNRVVMRVLGLIPQAQPPSRNPFK